VLSDFVGLLVCKQGYGREILGVNLGTANQQVYSWDDLDWTNIIEFFSIMFFVPTSTLFPGA